MKTIKKSLITTVLSSLALSTSIAHASDLKMNIKTSPAPKIVGGEVTPEGERPWMTSLQYNDQHFCGASLIAEQWVLTAAHCVEDITKENLNGLAIRANFIDLTKESGIKVSVEDVFIHQDYNQQGKDAADIALIKLSEKITDVPFVKLATDEIISLAGTAGTMASVSGWGALEQGGQSPDILQKVSVPLVTNEQCNSAAAYDGKVSVTEICAGYAKGGKDSCQGDSGGPLVITHEGEFVQAGVVSWGEGCAQADKYGVYARVNSFNTWLADVLDGNGSGLGGGDQGGGEEPQDGYLISGLAITDIEAQTDEEILFKIDVGSRAKLLWFDITNGEGDADIYIKYDAEPTLNDYDFAPLEWGNEEQVLIKRPTEGTWYIKVVGYEAFSGLELMGFTR